MAPGTHDKPLVWLHGAIKTPPFSQSGRIDAGVLLRRLQSGERIGMPHCRPMPSIGSGCHELRVHDAGHSWRIVCLLDAGCDRDPRSLRENDAGDPDQCHRDV
jgi:phage-related protein